MLCFILGLEQAAVGGLLKILVQSLQVTLQRLLDVVGSVCFWVFVVKHFVLVRPISLILFADRHFLIQVVGASELRDDVFEPLDLISPFLIALPDGESGQAKNHMLADRLVSFSWLNTLGTQSLQKPIVDLAHIAVLDLVIS